MGGEKIGNREPCSAKIVIIQTVDDEGLDEGRSVEGGQSGLGGDLEDSQFGD